MVELAIRSLYRSSEAKFFNMKLHVHPPQGPHTHTFVLLHGRGSNGPEFCDELFQSVTSQMKNLPDSLPNFRWVFPSSGIRYSTAFDEHEPAWFDIYSLENPNDRQDLQVDGLRESVLAILSVLNEEIKLVDGDSSRVFLGGISQGMATSLFTFLCAPGRINRPLGGILGFCGWLPFAQQAEDLLRRQQAQELLRKYQINHRLSEPSGLDKRGEMSKLFLETIAGADVHQITADTHFSVLSTPVFISHGIDDTLVSLRVGRQASRILQQIDVPTQWRVFTGAVAGGHWIKEPEGFDNIVQFVQTQVEGNK